MVPHRAGHTCFGIFCIPRLTVVNINIVEKNYSKAIDRNNLFDIITVTITDFKNQSRFHSNDEREIKRNNI